MSFLRFVGPGRDCDSGVGPGIFMAAFGLRESGALPDYEYERLASLIEWFNENLRRPDRFARSPRKPPRAVCWFKPSAGEHLAKAHELAALLLDYGVPVRMIKTARVGYVVYEDEHQIVAEPYADTPR